MSKAINLKTLNQFIQYPYLVMGWDVWAGGYRSANRSRQYSLYEMVNPGLIELVPLPPSLIEDVLMPGFEEMRQSTRTIYQNCIFSSDWISPFTKGCVKSLREMIQALESLGLLLPEYWEEKDKKRKSAQVLRDSATCAYNLLNDDFCIKRGNRTMAKANGAVAVAETKAPDTDDKPKRKSGVSIMNEVYSEMTRADKPSIDGLKIIYGYLERACGGTENGLKLVALFNEHINSEKKVYAGMAEPATISEFINFLRSWGSSEEAVQLMTADILEKAQDSFDLESASAEVEKVPETAKTK